MVQDSQSACEVSHLYQLQDAHTCAQLAPSSRCSSQPFWLYYGWRKRCRPCLEIFCPPGQFKDVLTNLGPPWEVHPVPAVPATGTCLGPVCSADPSRAPWWNPDCGCQGIGKQGELGESLAEVYPMLRRHHNILDHLPLISQPTSGTYLQPYPHFFTRKVGREVTIPPACRYLLAPSGALQHVEQSYKNLKSHLIYRLVYRTYVFLL